MITARIDPTFESWREKARGLLLQAAPPESVHWADGQAEASLLQEESPPATPSPAREIRVPPDFMPLATHVCAHTDSRRWAILYRLLYRLTIKGERHLLNLPTDKDVRLCLGWEKAVRREIHHMHAYVRFRQIGQDEATGREQFVAWYEPEYPILRLTASFFRKRFTGMDWSILTPDECAHWDGSELTFSPGVPRGEAPAGDAQDDLWRTYYRSIFNPARLKVQTMQSSMPQKYWKNLPEAQIIQDLISGSQDRVEAMLDTPVRPVKPLPPGLLRKQAKAQKDPPTEPPHP